MTAIIVRNGYVPLGAFIVFISLISTLGAIRFGWLPVLLLAIVMPCLILWTRSSRWFMPYILTIWVVAPEIRRLYDWTIQEYSSMSLIIITPLLCSLFIALSIKKEKKLDKRMTKTLPAIFILFGLMSVIGFMKNGMSALYDLGNYVMPMLALYYMATSEDKKLYALLTKTFYALGVIVAVYGWIQYVWAPPWDTFWMIGSEMRSIGLPEPFEIRVFSLLNSPGPCGMFLAVVLAMCLMDRQLSKPVQLLLTAVIGSTLLLTSVRTAWIFVVAVLLFVAISNYKKDGFKQILKYAVTITAVILISINLPAFSHITDRLASFSDIENDHSFNERMELLDAFVPLVLLNPVGSGFGSNGLGTKINNGGEIGSLSIVDNGFLSIGITFGLFGFIVYFWAISGTLRDLYRYKLPHAAGEYKPVFYAAIISMAFGNGLIGLSGFCLWLMMAMPLLGSEVMNSSEGS